MKMLFFALLSLSFNCWSQSNWTETYSQLVNEHRSELDMKKLVYSEGIEAIARKHSLDMALQERSFGHDGFSFRCNQVRKLFTRTNRCGEIVAWGHDGPKDVFEGWMSSPGHRKNIENSHYTHSGMGFAISEKGHIYWTQIFIEVVPRN